MRQVNDFIKTKHEKTVENKRNIKSIKKTRTQIPPSFSLHYANVFETILDYLKSLIFINSFFIINIIVQIG